MSEQIVHRVVIEVHQEDKGGRVTFVNIDGVPVCRVAGVWNDLGFAAWFNGLGARLRDTFTSLRNAHVDHLSTEGKQAKAAIIKLIEGQ